MPKSRSPKNQKIDDEFLNKETALTSQEIMQYFGVAAAVSALPVYLYIMVYGLSLASYGIVYVPTFAASTYLLGTANRNVAEAVRTVLSNARKNAQTNQKKQGLTREEVDAMREAITLRESVVWSFFRNNLIFMLAFVFMSSYAFTHFEPSYTYPLSVVLAGILAERTSHLHL